MSDGIVIGLLLLAMVTGGRALKDAIPWGAGWVWPVPPWRTPQGVVLQPVVSQEWRATAPAHFGVDVMYRDAGGRYVAPPGAPVLAARDGVVWSVDRSARGIEVVIDHGAPFATYYQHLSTTTLPIGTAHGKAPGGGVLHVRAGEPLGTMGADPLDPAHVRHLHFAVWYKGNGDGASVDPRLAMAEWGKAQPWEA